MLVPVGSQLNETFEKNEVERIEYLTENNKYTKQESKKKQNEDKKKTSLSALEISDLNVYAYAPVLLNQRIYLLQKSLLI